MPRSPRTSPTTTRTRRTTTSRRRRAASTPIVTEITGLVTATAELRRVNTELAAENEQV